jgi:hypothetical protein
MDDEDQARAEAMAKLGGILEKIFPGGNYALFFGRGSEDAPFSIVSSWDMPQLTEILSDFIETTKMTLVPPGRRQ